MMMKLTESRLRQLIREEAVLQEQDGLSEETLEFLRDWMWNQQSLRNYQKNGVKAIPNKIVQELQQFRPSSKKIVFRIFDNLESEMQSRQNKLLSFSPNLGTAKMMWEDKQTVGHPGSYLYQLEVSPDQVLVDTSTFRQNYDDIIPEVIVMTDKANIA
jgi:hypothetical protein